MQHHITYKISERVSSGFLHLVLLKYYFFLIIFNVIIVIIFIIIIIIIIIDILSIVVSKWSKAVSIILVSIQIFWCLILLDSVFLYFY